MAPFAPGTLGDPEDDGSALDGAPGTSEEREDDGSDDDDGLDPELLKAENDRLRNAHRQLLSEKTTFEKTREENANLKSLLFEMNNRRTAPAEPVEPEDDVDWDATLAELRRSDDPRDKVTLELTRELYRTKQKLDTFEKKAVAAKDIPDEDMPEVEELMKSGDFRTYKAAHRAVLGARYETLKSKLTKKDDPEPPKKQLRPTPPARPAAQGGAPTIRSVPRDKAAQRVTIRSSEYREHLKGPDASKWRKRHADGELDISLG